MTTYPINKNRRNKNLNNKGVASSDLLDVLDVLNKQLLKPDYTAVEYVLKDICDCGRHKPDPWGKLGFSNREPFYYDCNLNYNVEFLQESLTTLKAFEKKNYMRIPNKIMVANAVVGLKKLVTKGNIKAIKLYTEIHLKLDGLSDLCDLKDKIPKYDIKFRGIPFDRISELENYLADL